ncbi:conserved hypothetical protein, partial [Ricinus communis]
PAGVALSAATHRGAGRRQADRARVHAHQAADIGGVAAIVACHRAAAGGVADEASVIAHQRAHVAHALDVAVDCDVADGAGAAGQIADQPAHAAVARHVDAAQREVADGAGRHRREHADVVVTGTADLQAGDDVAGAIEGAGVGVAAGDRHKAAAPRGAGAAVDVVGQHVGARQRLRGHALQAVDIGQLERRLQRAKAALHAQEAAAVQLEIAGAEAGQRGRVLDPGAALQGERPAHRHIADGADGAAGVQRQPAGRHGVAQRVAGALQLDVAAVRGQRRQAADGVAAVLQRDAAGRERGEVGHGQAVDRTGGLHDGAAGRH